MVGIKVNEVQSRIKIGVGKTLNDCFITKNRNVASNMKLPKIENEAGITERRKYKLLCPLQIESKRKLIFLRKRWIMVINEKRE